MKQRIIRFLGWFAPIALAVTPLAAAQATRAGDNARFYSPRQSHSSQAYNVPPRGEDKGIIAELPVWQALGGVTLVTLIILAVSGGGNRGGDGGYQSNGAN